MSTAVSSPTDTCLAEVTASTSEVSLNKDGDSIAASYHAVVIIDMSRCSFTDSDGAKAICNVCESLQSIGKTVMMTSCSGEHHIGNGI